MTTSTDLGIILGVCMIAIVVIMTGVLRQAHIQRRKSITQGQKASEIESKLTPSTPDLLRAAFVAACIGAGLTLLFVVLAWRSQQSAFLIAAAVSLIPLLIACGLFLEARVRTHDLQRAGGTT